MSARTDVERLDDIAESINVIERHLGRGDVQDDLVFDACRVRIIEIGEAVKGIDPDRLASEPEVPWREIARMRDQLTHHYFDTQRAVVEQVVTEELAPLRQAIVRLRERLAETEPR